MIRTQESQRVTGPLSRGGWLAVATLCCLVALTLPLTGCGETKPVTPVNVEPEKTPEELAEEAEKLRIERIQEQFRRAKALIQQNPKEWSSHIQNLEGRLFEAKGTFLEADIQKALDGQIQAREKFAEDRLAAIGEQVRTLVKDADYLAAYEVLETFDEEGLLGETKAKKEAEQYFEYIRVREDAEVEFNRIERLARSRFRTGVKEEIAKAIGVLESYPDAYRDTVFYPQIREMIEEYLPVYEQMLKKELEEMNVEMTSIEVDDYLGNFRTYGDNVWNATDGVATGSNQTDQPAVIQIGEDNWTSYQLRMFMKVPEGDLARLAVTSRPGRGSVRQYGFYEVDIEDNDWFEVMITFRDGTVTVQNLSTREEMMDKFNPRSNQGCIALRIDPGESIEFKDVRVKVFSSFEPEEDE